MTKLEEVARAIHISDKQKTSRYFSNEVTGCSWEQLSMGVRQSYLSEARAAIKAMKNPTPEMLAAALPITGIDHASVATQLAEKALSLLEVRPVQSRVHKDGLTAALGLIGDWRAMIDCALEEK